MGNYSSVEPESLEVKIVDGKIGEGTIQGTTVEVQMPRAEEAVKELKQSIGNLLENIPPEDQHQKYQEILLAITSSTVLHEGTYGLIDSKPGSRLATALEKVSGIENQQGRVITLLDEGIAYAVQGVFAKDVKPLGSLAPAIKDTDDPVVKQRKMLGEKLRPKVEEYISQGKSVDEEFLAFVAEKLRGVL